MSMEQTKLAATIAATQVESGTVALFYLGQAGFWIKTANGRNIVIDVYLSDAAERLFGFKRMSPPVLDRNELDVDLYLATHAHIDHLDVDILPDVVRRPKVYFIGAVDCRDEFERQGLNSNRFTILREGDDCQRDGIKIRAIYADHGELAPEAVGLLLEIDGITIYHMGDTSYQPEKIAASLRITPDVMIAPINGAFGNMNAPDACMMAERIHPRFLIASHFWTFVEHVGVGGLGDPAAFREKGKTLPATVTPVILPPGSCLVVTNNSR